MWLLRHNLCHTSIINDLPVLYTVYTIAIGGYCKTSVKPYEMLVVVKVKLRL